MKKIIYIATEYSRDCYDAEPTFSLEEARSDMEFFIDHSTRQERSHIADIYLIGYEVEVLPGESAKDCIRRLSEEEVDIDSLQCYSETYDRYSVFTTTRDGWDSFEEDEGSGKHFSDLDPAWDAYDAIVSLPGHGKVLYDRFLKEEIKSFENEEDSETIYKIKPWNIFDFGSDASEDSRLTFDQIEMIARGWDKSIEEVYNMVEACDD